MNKNISQLNIICLESEAFYALVDDVVRRIQEKNNLPKEEDEWISKEEAMTLLRITSDTTLQKYRDEGRIRFNPINRRVILYSRSSISKFLKTSIKDSF